VNTVLTASAKQNVGKRQTRRRMCVGGSSARPVCRRDFPQCPE